MQRSRCEKIDTIIFPATITMVVETRVCGRLANFNLHSLIVQCQIDDVPGSAQMRRPLANEVGMDFLQEFLEVWTLLQRRVEVDIHQRACCPICFRGHSPTNLVGDLVTREEKDNPTQRLANLLLISGRFNHDMFPFSEEGCLRPFHRRDYTRFVSLSTPQDTKSIRNQSRCASRGYITIWQPEHIAIWSTLPIGTTRQVSDKAVHTPVTGKHPNLADSIRRMRRW